MNIIGCCLLLVGLLQPFKAPAMELHVCAAASLTEALTEAVRQFEEKSPIQVYMHLAGSRILRIQIEKGLPCDLFLPAHFQEAEELIRLKILAPKDVVPFLKNELVIISPSGETRTLNHLKDIVTMDMDWLAMAHPDYIPAGMYAKEALMKAGVWDLIKERITFALDVKAALAQVAQGHARLGIVYKTDALLSNRVRIVYTIPFALHSPIQYPLCVLRQSGKESAAESFQSFLLSERAQRIFIRYGFEVQ